MYKTTDKQFVEHVKGKLLDKYKCNYWKQEQSAKCGSSSFQSQEQQKFVSRYFDIHNPSKGLTLWHGLGSGKTCSAIFISNYMRRYKDICVIAPAMLRDNFAKELDTCGFHITNKIRDVVNQSVFSESGVAESGVAESGIAEEEETLVADMSDYAFLSSNGNLNNFKEEFYPRMDGKLIILDESQILLNKINNSFVKQTKPNAHGGKGTSFIRFYNHMIHRQDIKSVCLSGTPIEKSENELYLLLNMMSGSRPRFIVKGMSFTQENLRTFLMKGFDTPEKNSAARELLKMIDFQESSVNDDGDFIIYKNPYGYVNSFDSTHEYKGLVYSREYSHVSKDDLLDVRAMYKEQVEVPDTPDRPASEPPQYIYQMPLNLTFIDSTITHSDFEPLFLKHLRQLMAADFHDFFIPFPTTFLEKPDRKFLFHIQNKLENNASGVRSFSLSNAVSLESLNAYESTSIRKAELQGDKDYFQRHTIGKLSYFGNIDKILPRVHYIQEISQLYGLIPQLSRYPCQLYYGLNNASNLFYYVVKMNMQSVVGNGQKEAINYLKSIESSEREPENSYFKKIFSANMRQFTYSVPDYQMVSSNFMQLLKGDGGYANFKEFEDSIKKLKHENYLAYKRRPYTQTTQHAFDTLEKANKFAKESMKGTLIEYIWKDTYEKDEKVASVFAKELQIGNLANHSIKMDSIISSIKAKPNDLHIVFSQYYQANIPFARALNANGLEEFRIGTHRSSPNEVQRRYMFLTGDSGDVIDNDKSPNPFFTKHSTNPRSDIHEIHYANEGHTSKKDKQSCIDLFNSPGNMNGNLCQVVILNTSAAEGITLKRVRYVHLLHNTSNMSKLFQIVGRAIRNCTHEGFGFAEEEKTVLPLLYLYDDETPESIDKNQVIKYETMVNENDSFIPILDLFKTCAIDKMLNDNIENGECSGSIKPISLDIDERISKRNYSVTKKEQNRAFQKEKAQEDFHLSTILGGFKKRITKKRRKRMTHKRSKK